jgi:hypothetical protein
MVNNRRSKIWNLTQKYLEVEVTREAKLDPSKQYLFGFYPHGTCRTFSIPTFSLMKSSRFVLLACLLAWVGILILSRVAMYGGVFDDLFPGLDVRSTLIIVRLTLCFC